MFTRRNEQRAGKPLQDHQFNVMEAEEARVAQAPIRLATATDRPPDAQTSAPSTVPPPIPENLPVTAVDLAYSVIGEDLTIEGQAITIRCKGELEINGNIQAELHSKRLKVGKSGRVEGTISADNVEVWGHVSGTIKGAKVALQPGAEVDGDILAKTLSVADGASFEGRSRKVTDLESIAPQLVATIPKKPADSPIAVPLPQARE